jgi:hypothetical protein
MSKDGAPKAQVNLPPKPGAVLLEGFQVFRAEAAARVQVFKTAALDEKTRVSAISISWCYPVYG